MLKIIALYISAIRQLGNRELHNDEGNKTSLPADGSYSLRSEPMVELWLNYPCLTFSLTLLAGGCITAQN